MRFSHLLPIGLALACTTCPAQGHFIPSAVSTSVSTGLPDAPSTARVAEANAAPLEADGADPAPQPKDDVTLKMLPLNFLRDEVGIFTSPARITRSDLKWLLPLAGATTVSIGTDTYTMRNVVSQNTSFNNANATASDALRGAAIGLPVLLFAAGHFRADNEMRRTGLLAGEAMVDAYAFDAVIKFATLRERPKVANARGHFFTGDAVSDPSFVSGHSIVTWSSAAVLAGEYNRPWQQVAIYSLATGASLTRVLSQNHFPTDALLGSAAGWLIGHYVFRTHTKHHTH